MFYGCHLVQCLYRHFMRVGHSPLFVYCEFLMTIVYMCLVCGEGQDCSDGTS